MVSNFLFMFFILIFVSKKAPEADSNISFCPLPAILVNMEAKKESARHAQQVLSKTPKESRHVKNVQSIRTSLILESLPRQTARHVLTCVVRAVLKLPITRPLVYARVPPCTNKTARVMAITEGTTEKSVNHVQRELHVLLTEQSYKI